ncbi:MAG: hypothetical protein K2N49_00170 [Ruminococcus sp.]|nr:hypothetical protein [Ruminococcus sp.]
MINITLCCYAASLEEVAESFQKQLSEFGYTVDEIVDLAKEKKFASIPVSVMNLMWKNTDYVRDSLGIPNLGGIYDYYLNNNTRYQPEDNVSYNMQDLSHLFKSSFDHNAVKDENGNITQSKIDEMYIVSGKIHIIETPYDDSTPSEKLIQVDINAPKISLSSSKVTQNDCYGNVSVSVTDKLSGLTVSYSFPCCITLVSIYSSFQNRNSISCNLRLSIVYYVENTKKTGDLYFGLSKTNSIDFVMNGIYDNSTSYSSLLNSSVYHRYESSYGGINGGGWSFGYITSYFVCNNEMINKQFTQSFFGTEYGNPPSFNIDNKFSANTVINNSNALDIGVDINAGFLALGTQFDTSIKAAVDAVLKGYAKFYSNQPAPGDSFTSITNNSYNYTEMVKEDKEPEPTNPPGGGGSSSEDTALSNSILTNILNAITSIKNGFVEGIVYLFKPSDNLFNEIQEIIETKFSFVNQILDLGKSVITADFSESPPDFNITFYGKEISFIDWSVYNDYKPFADGIIICISYYFYIHKLIKRIPSIIGGFSS